MELKGTVGLAFDLSVGTIGAEEERKLMPSSNGGGGRSFDEKRRDAREQLETLPAEVRDLIAR